MQMGLRARQTMVFEAAQQEIQAGGPGNALQMVSSHPSSSVISSALRAGEDGGWLPPELRRPLPEYWQLNQALGTHLESESSVAVSGLISPVFVLKADAILVMAKGSVRLFVQSVPSNIISPMVELVDAGGGWSRWGARIGPGNYRLLIDRNGSRDQVTLLWPRPMSGVGFFGRKILLHAPALLAIAIAAWGVSLGWLCWDHASGGASPANER